MRNYLFIIILLLNISCKTKALIVEKEVSNTLSADKIIANHYNNKLSFATLNIKAKTKYEDAKQTQNVTTEIRIKENEIILVSIRFLGITMAKALITPTRVQYYEKIGGKYFDGDFAALSAFLGNDLNYEKVQNLFLGKALEDLKSEKYSTKPETDMYGIENILNQEIKKELWFDNQNFVLNKETLAQINQQRILQITYPNYTLTAQGFLPQNIEINVNQENKITNLNFEYTSTTFNEELTFPYSVPEGYERIFIP